MSLTITSLRTDYRKTEGDGKVWLRDVPYIIVNITFKFSICDESDGFIWERTKAEAGEFSRVLTIDDPERYNAWLIDPKGWEFSSRYDGYGKAWTHNDPPYRYIEKFDTFWLREWISDCSVTRSILDELTYYKYTGKLPTAYRHTDDCVVLQHLRTLQDYWD